jgi:hypothetical protein
VTTDLNTLLTALYVKIDDWLGRSRRMGRPPRLSDAELLTLAVAQALLGVRSEARWLRFVPAHLPGAFPYLPGQSGYNKRLRAAVPLLKRAIRAVATDTDLWPDPTWVVDSTPVECARSRPAVHRSALAGWAGYGYCASHSRFFWGLRLHLVCTPAGLPIAWALATPKVDERQLIESVNDTLKGQLDLELHGGRSIEGVAARVAQRLLAMTAAIWHNRNTGQPLTRSLIAYDH